MDTVVVMGRAGQGTQAEQRWMGIMGGCIYLG